MERISDLPFPQPALELVQPEDRQFTVNSDVRRALSGLALALNHTLEAPQLMAMALTLRDLDSHLIRRACLQLASSATFWPKPVEIRRVCEQLAHTAAEAEAAAKLCPMPDDADPRTWVHCQDCQDDPSGWCLWYCRGGGVLADRDRPSPDRRHQSMAYCGRKLIHPPHSYTARCACYETNPVIARKREAARSSRG